MRALAAEMVSAIAGRSEGVSRQKHDRDRRGSSNSSSNTHGNNSNSISIHNNKSHFRKCRSYVKNAKNVRNWSLTWHAKWHENGLRAMRAVWAGFSLVRGGGYFLTLGLYMNR